MKNLKGELTPAESVKNSNATSTKPTGALRPTPLPRLGSRPSLAPAVLPGLAAWLSPRIPRPLPLTGALLQRKSVANGLAPYDGQTGSWFPRGNCQFRMIGR